MSEKTDRLREASRIAYVSNPASDVAWAISVLLADMANFAESGSDLAWPHPRDLGNAYALATAIISEWEAK